MNGNISPNTVKKIVKENKGVAKKCEQKKEENTKEVLDYMDTLVKEKKELLKNSIEAMNKKILDGNSSLKELAIAYGTVLDKEMNYKKLKQDILSEEDKEKKINDNILSITKLLNNPVKERTEADLNE